MNGCKIDDTFFKDEIDYKNLDESIYTQFAKTMAKNVDIDLAKTPLVDILTGYTRYRILQSKIDKAIEYINKHIRIDDEYPDYMEMLIEERDELLNILNGEVEIPDDEEEEKKIPEKLDDFTIAVGSVDESNIEEYIQTLFNQQYEIFNKINSIIDYLKSKGE
jgi:hypothetical protein